MLNRLRSLVLKQDLVYSLLCVSNKARECEDIFEDDSRPFSCDTENHVVSISAVERSFRNRANNFLPFLVLQKSFRPNGRLASTF